MQLKRTFLLQPERLIAILITAAAVALHFYYWFYVGGLWRDEVNLISISSRHSLAEMQKDSFPIMMPLFVHLWLAAGLGNGDLSLRFLGLLVGLGILAVLWVSSWKTRQAPPLLGLVLFALNSTLIFFGDTIRAYGLGSLLVIALTASAFLFLQRPSGSRAAWLALFAILSVQALYHNAVVVAAICFGAWAVCWRRHDKRAALQILAVAIVSAASLLPYLHSLTVNTDTSLVLRTGINKFWFISTYRNAFDFPIPGYGYDWIILLAVIVIYAGAGLWQKAGADTQAVGAASLSDLSLFAMIAIILAGLAFPVFFWSAQLPMESWYLLPFMALVVACFDGAFPVFRGLVRIIFLAFVVLTALLSVRAASSYVTNRFSNVNVYARLLATQAAPSDYIIVCPWNYGITYNYYFKGAASWETLPPLADHSTHRYDLMKPQMQNTNALTPVFRQISQTLQSGHRVWVISDPYWIAIPKPGTPPPGTLPPPPLKYTGWAWSPYSQAWARQTAWFLAHHSSEFRQLPPPKEIAGQRFITENVTLFVADGWSTNSTP